MRVNEINMKKLLIRSCERKIKGKKEVKEERVIHEYPKLGEDDECTFIRYSSPRKSDGKLCRKIIP